MSERRAIYKASEHEEQVALFEWAAMVPELQWMFAIPNGGARHIAVAGKLKAEGVKRGVPDIFLPLARRGYHGLFIEMKSDRGRTSPEQREWIEGLRRNGYVVAVCYGQDIARALLASYVFGQDDDFGIVNP